MRTLILSAAAPLALLASPVAAQETTEDAPFAGLYVGASGGYDVQGNDIDRGVLFDRDGNGDFNDTVTTAAGTNAFSPGFCNGAAVDATTNLGCRNDKDGWSYNGRVGFDIQKGPFVVGAVGEFGKSEIRDSVSAFSTTPANYVLTRELNWEATARVRAGYAVNTTLFYASGGAGYANIDNSFSTTNTANAFATNGNDKVWGYVAGGGVEQKIGRNFSIGMEYSFHNYKDNDYRVNVTQGTAPATNPFILSPNTAGTTFRRADENFRWHSLRAVAAFRF